MYSPPWDVSLKVEVHQPLSSSGDEERRVDQRYSHSLFQG